MQVWLTPVNGLTENLKIFKFFKLMNLPLNGCAFEKHKVNNVVLCI